MLYHQYIFLGIRSSFFDLPLSKQSQYKISFLKTLKKEKKVHIATYTVVGFKNDIRILLWLQSDTLEDVHLLLTTLLHSQLGKYFVIVHTLLGMARPTQYSEKSTIHLRTLPKGKKYLIIYPFTKTKEWYMMDFDTRRQLMGGHVGIGKKYPEIEQVLLYSYGVDDQEFIVSYETNDLLLFQSLVMELRSDKVRAYTQSDTPIFTCIATTPQEALNFL